MEEQKTTPRRVVISFDVGIKNLACCVMSVGDKSDEMFDIILWHIIALARPKEKIPNVQELSLRLFAELDDMCEVLEQNGFHVVDDVLVENQPSRLNGAMKTIQMMIYSYFQLRRHWEGRVSSVHMISASGKLKDHHHTVDTSQCDKTGYELNKWKAVKLAQIYLQSSPKLQGIFDSYNKQDDMADSMLQGVAWLRKQKYNILHARAYEMI